MTCFIKLPKKANRKGAAINLSQLKKALEVLGISKPLTIKWSSGKNRRGCYRVKDYFNEYNYEHSITVSTFLTLEEVEKTLWHELTHAAQVERLGPKRNNELYRMFQRRFYYENNPAEKEANAQALCRPFNITLNNKKREKEEIIEEARKEKEIAFNHIANYS